MYCDFYQLTERPFNVTPDPKILYLNARYREAIASLHYGITQRKGFITLIGEAGTGKTTLLKKLLEDLDSKTRTVFIFNTNVSFEEILEYIFAEFDLPVLNGRKLYMLQRLNAFLLEELRNGGNVALLIDEAQDLEFSVLEDLRLLSNLETAKEKILQIVLSGQPELGQKLSNPGLRQLRQRIGINCRLPPLSRDEVTEYIQCRLEATHCPDLKLFSREAEDEIFRFSRGIPRLVNVVSDNALVIGYALGRKRIGADIIAEAAADLMSVEPQVGDYREAPVVAAPPPVADALPSRWSARLGVSGVVIAVMLVGLLSVGRTMLNRRADDQPNAQASHVRAGFEVIRPGSEPRGSGLGYPAAEPAAAEPLGAADSADVKALPEIEPMGSARGAAERHPDAVDGQLATGKADTSSRQAGSPAKQEVAAPKQDSALAKADTAAPTADVAPRKRDDAATRQRDTAEPARRDVAASHPDGAPPKQEPLVPKADVAVPKVEAAAPKAEAVAPKLAAVAPNPHGGENPIETTFGDRSSRLDSAQYVPVVAQAGDSISAIARHEYGQASYTILDLLELANPELRNLDTIAVGQTIRLPSLAGGFPILADESGHYALLVLSTPQQRRATALQEVLQGHGFQAKVTPGSAGTGRPLYRVVVPGPGARDDVVGMGKQVQKVFRDDKRLAQLGE